MIVSLPSLPGPIDTSGAAWQALRGFTFSAIVLNLGGAFISLMIIKMCTDVPLAAQRRVLEGTDSPLQPSTRPPNMNLPTAPLTRTPNPLSNAHLKWVFPNNDNMPLAVAQGGVLVPDLLNNRFLLLERFGMSKWYKNVDLAISWVVISACICTFAALTFWVFLNEWVVTAGLTMISFISTAVIAIGVLFVGGYGQR